MRKCYCGNMRRFKRVGIGCWTFALLQLQSIFYHLSLLFVVKQKNSARIIRTANQITTQRHHIDCGDEVVGFKENSVEFHLRHVDSENVAFGFWLRKKRNKNFPIQEERRRRIFLRTKKSRMEKLLSFADSFSSGFRFKSKEIATMESIESCDGHQKRIFNCLSKNRMWPDTSEITTNPSMDRMTCKAFSANFTLLMNSFLCVVDEMMQLETSLSSIDERTSLHTTTLPQDVIDIALCEFSMKTVSTNRKLMEIARAGKCRWSFPSWNRNLYDKFQLRSFAQTHWPNAIPFLDVTTNIPESFSLQLKRMLWTLSNFSGNSKESANKRNKMNFACLKAIQNWCHSNRSVCHQLLLPEVLVTIPRVLSNFRFHLTPSWYI